MAKAVASQMAHTQSLAGFLNMLLNWKVLQHPSNTRMIEAGVTYWEWVARSGSGVVTGTIPTITLKAPVEIPKGRMDQRNTYVARCVVGHGLVLHIRVEVRNVSRIHQVPAIQMIMVFGVSGLPEDLTPDCTSRMS